MPSMEFKCDVCGIVVHTQVHWDDHLRGKSHQHNTEHKTQMERLARHSVYLNNFTKPIDEAEVAQTMDQFGEVDRVVADRSGKSAFAIVEFREQDAAQNLLHSISRLRIGNCNNVRIQPRRVDFGDTFSSSHSFQEQAGQLKSEDVLHCLDEVGASDLQNQLNALVAKFSIAPETMNERGEFAQKLGQFIQQYFSSQIHIHVFGSSSTGLGFVNADLDLNLVFDEDLRETTELNGYDSSVSRQSAASVENMEEEAEANNKRISPETLKQSPMDRTTFMGLPKIEQVRLLNRIINKYRKATGLITAHVPIPDARTPVVRFLLRHPDRFPCELSVQNLLGECKANLIRDLVRAETTGTLWRLLFLIKLWSSCNGLFSFSASNLSFHKENKKVKKEMEPAEEEEPKQQNKNQPNSHWNSYTLSLLLIAFLQLKGRVPPVQLVLRPNSRTIQGWPIEYDLSFFALEGDIPTLLREFFVFLYQQLKENHVIVPREGRVIEKGEFKGRYLDEDKRIEKKWRFSLVNVQDPIELSHNVAANVGKQYVAMLRWKIMYGISVLKRSPNDLRSLFRLDNPQQLQAEQRAEKMQKKEGESRKQNGEGRGKRRAKDKEHNAMEMEVDEE